MSEPNEKLEADRRLLVEARSRGRGATLLAFVRLSGPGWLQSAMTLGGGSLSSSLYLGVLAGFSLLWLQPLAMVMGIIMLGAIGYVTMSTGERPFQAINRHINPVLGWGWAIAALAANMVWAMPQYSLANGVLQQNLLPGLLGSESAAGDFGGKVIISAAILLLATAITWSYDSGGWGVKLYERILKLMVAVIVACFLGVVVRLFLEEGVRWGELLRGFVPDLGSLFRPAPEFAPLLEAVADESRAYWRALIVGTQRDVMVSAAATAVGINMTFLFPYSILKRGWGREFRSLALFDLGTGMFIPYVLATSCVVVAAATQFHCRPQPGLLESSASVEAPVTASPKLRDDYEKLLRGRLRAVSGEAAAGSADGAGLASLPEAEKRLAATLVTRDALDLSRALEPFTGRVFSSLVFGIGVLGMALSTITLLMLISGFVICELLGLPPRGWPHRLGTLAAATGVLGPFLWSKAAFWLAIPTSVFGLTLLPIAYLTFYLLMNQKSLLGADLPRGGRRLAWNTLMGIAALVSLLASAWVISTKGGTWGMGLAAGFLGLAAAVQVARRRRPRG
jgi:Mn2+/Fe2+ NRAMP family transporter